MIYTVTVEFDLEANNVLEAEERFHEFINTTQVNEQGIEFFLSKIEELPPSYESSPVEEPDTFNEHIEESVMEF